MLRERVANNIYVFSSELYAQVTASVILTPAGAIVIDTLPFPVETQTIVRFVEERHGVPVRYVVNTHYHADHTYGTCFFKQARVVSHRLCRSFLNERGRAGLERDQQGSREMSTISLRLPDIIFDKGEMFLHLGGTTLKMWHAPGHSPDNILCLVEEEQILFAADVLMPLPFFSDGNWSDYVATLESLRGQAFESVVQGHGEVILRGEVQSKIEDDLAYLHTIRKKVQRVIKKELGREALAKIDIESCGKSRIPLNGLVQQLHHSNLETLYAELVEAEEDQTGGQG